MRSSFPEFHATVLLPLVQLPTRQARQEITVASESRQCHVVKKNKIKKVEYSVEFPPRLLISFSTLHCSSPHLTSLSGFSLAPVLHFGTAGGTCRVRVRVSTAIHRHHTHRIISTEALSLPPPSSVIRSFAHFNDRVVCIVSCSSWPRFWTSSLPYRVHVVSSPIGSITRTRTRTSRRTSEEDKNEKH